MRRISLALALVGAVAAAGCSGGAKSSSDAGGNPGVADGFFTVTVKPTGGGVVLNPGAIACAAGAVCTPTFPLGTTVTITKATGVTGANLGWAGDCSGWEACVLTGNADKYVLVSFGDITAASGHPNWSDPVLHAEMFTARPTGFPECTKCHGAQLQGVGLALSCNTCHPAPPANGGPGALAGDHFDPASPAFVAYPNRDKCAACHTADGGRENVLGTYTSGARTTGPLKCDTCHTTATGGALLGDSTPTTVEFASGLTASADATTTLCANCHGGRESNVSLNAIIGQTGDDTVIAPWGEVGKEKNSFVNPHYLGATATLFGSEAQGWAQYGTNTYAGKFTHFAEGTASCSYCHDVHTGVAKVSTTSCGQCHFTEAGLPVANVEQLKESTTVGYEGDMDGDGTVEGLGHEFEGLEHVLELAYTAYARDVVGTGIVYDSGHPYFMADADNNGVADVGADGKKIAYNQFTPRLLRATFNYKWAHAEPGAWAHNPRYAFAALFDSIADLNAGLTAAGKTPVAFTGLREFVAPSVAHFDATSEAWSDHTAEGACVACHTTKGFQNVTDGGTRTGFLPASPLACAACHADATVDSTNYDVRAVASVTFGNAPAVTVMASQFEKPADALCSKCHSGRENAAKVTSNIGPKLATDWTVSFTNPHYAGAAAILFGAESKAMYQYAGKEYHGKAVMFDSPHGSPHGASCVGCHNPITSKHEFEISDADMTPVTGYCGGCHVTKSYGDFRLLPLKANMEALTEQLRLLIVAYSQDPANRPLVDADADPATPSTPAVLGTDFNGVCFGEGYPYVFADNGRTCLATETTCDVAVTPVANDGICQPGEGQRPNAAKLNPAAAKAAFNWKWAAAEPGGFAHNYEYMAQGVIDSILDLDADAVLPFDAFKNDGTTRIVRP